MFVLCYVCIIYIGIVTTLAGGGGGGFAGYSDGIGKNALFSGPLRACIMGSLIYVTDTGNNVIRSITTSGVLFY